MEPDNSLAETLGNLGSSLRQAFDPMRQIQAQSLLQEQQQRAFELQKARQLDAANANAAEVFGNANPLRQDPASLEVTKAAIRAGNYPGMESIVNGLSASANFTDRQKAADLFVASHSTWDQSHLSAAHARILAGQTDASGAEKDYADAAETTNRADATIRGTTSARAAGASTLAPANADLAAEAAARGDVAAAGKTIAQSDVLNTPSPPKLASPEATTLGTKQAIAGTTPPAGQAPTSELQPQLDINTAARAGEVARQTEVGKIIGGGMQPTGTFLPFGLPGSTTNPFGSPVPAPDTPTPPTPSVSLANPANPSATPVPVVTSTPTPSNPAAAVVGQSEGERAQTAILDKATRDTLQEAIDGGVAALKLKNLTARIRTLAELAGASGPEQLPTAIVQRLADMNLRFTKRSEILAEMDSLFKAQIPELRKDMGVKFEAGPELSAQSKMVGVSNLPTATLMGILARQDAIADLAIQRRQLAQRALIQSDNPLPMKDYYGEENKIYDQLPAHTQELLKLYGANAAPSAGAPPTTAGGAPATPENGFSAFLHWFTGGGSQAQPAGPAPAGSHELKMIDGKWQ
jgi:hypothetical protein